MSESIVLQGRFSPDQEMTYAYLPFEMPDGVVKLTVHYSYSDAIGSDPHLTGGNTVDIGIFDVRGTAFLQSGFRGWSGSARNSFFIGLDTSTPGYMPGPIQAGTWYICCGLYKISDKGCEYRVEITLDLGAVADGSFPELLELREQPQPARRRSNGWYKGELHCHTMHSDGDGEAQTVVEKAEALGLDFLAITDHNTRTAQISLRDIETPLILIPGMEVTTYNGHWNIWGTGDWVDFRVLESAKMQDAIAFARSQDYLTSCNHPKQFGPDWVFKDVDNFDCIEIWNGPWVVFNSEALAFWENKLRTGQRYPAVGGSDAHFHHREHIAQIGQPTTWIYCEGDPSASSLLTGIRAGHVFITNAPDGPELYLTCGDAMMGDSVHINAQEHKSVTVEVVGGQGLTLELWGTNGMLYRTTVTKASQHIDCDIATAGERYVRAQLTDGQSTDAEIQTITNPIYFVEGT